LLFGLVSPRLAYPGTTGSGGVSVVYVIAFVVAVGVAYLAWRAFKPEQDVTPSSRRRGPIGPDDDPDFLFDLNNERRRSRRSDVDKGDDPQAPTAS
jgi:hypothetical protein